MEEIPHRGELVIARITGQEDHPFYALRGKIRTGPLAQHDCVIRYKGKSERRGEVMVRIEVPFKQEGLEQKVLTTHFVTAETPQGFQCTASNETILYAIWEQGMNESFPVPNVWRIAQFFDVGLMPKTLHYGIKEGEVVAYDLSQRCAPKEYKSEDKIARGVESALRRYLNRVAVKFNNAPRLVTIDARIPRGRIMRAMERHRMQIINLQPQW